MIDIGGGHRVWTKKVGNAAVKVLLLHGGPGADHTYFECFEAFLAFSTHGGVYGFNSSTSTDLQQLWQRKI